MSQQPRKPALDFALLVLMVLGSLFLLTQMHALFAQIWKLMKVVFTPFLIAIIISYMLNPIVTKLVKRGVPRSASILIIYVIFFSIVAVVLVNTLPRFIEQVKDFAESLPALIQRVDRWLDQLADGTRSLPPAVRVAVENNLDALQRAITGATGNFLSMLGKSVEQILIALVIPFLVFYMLKDLKIMEKTVIALLPMRSRREWIQLLKSIDEALGNYIRGQLLVMLAVGLLVYAGYLIIGMPYPLMLAMIVAITNIIPYVGPFIGIAPALILALTVSPAMVLKVLIINLIVQQLEGNVISPQIVGKSLNLHPLLIMLSLLFGGEIGGVTGLILAVPLVAVAKVILQHVVLHYVRR
jgi:predicted PurR-regulated permease PerM